jgi:lipopolysaccharide/colanic/teichoic acid biosynthesis glycosyltransferase
MRQLPEFEAIDSLSLLGSGASGEVVDLAPKRLIELRVIDGGRSDDTDTAPAHTRGLLSAARWQVLIKRAVDLIGGLFLFTLLLPLLLTICALVRATSSGPALFAQERIGRDGRPFRMYKFRSMCQGAHLTRAELRNLNEVTGPVFKIRRDPRITPIGRLLRRLSIDELPQLINVVRGEMSLVGPRPPLPEEFATYNHREQERLSVKPGITCIWQVSGRSDLDFETWVEMDLEYISTWNLRRDFRLLLRTLPAVITGRGAY